MNTKFRVVIVCREGKEIEMGWELGNSSDPFSELNNGCFLYFFLFYVFLMFFFTYLFNM